MTERRNNTADPTAERTADQSTETESGVSAVEGTGAPGIRPRDEDEDDLIARNSQEPHKTPRRYDWGE